MEAEVAKKVSASDVGKVGGGSRRVEAAAAAAVVMCMTGAGMLGWWAWEFHPSNQKLWMVPAGLVMLGTPLVAWFSVAASGDGGDRRAWSLESQ